MSNPKHKFFRDELTENEVVRYDNGKEVTFEPSTPELKEGASDALPTSVRIQFHFQDPNSAKVPI